MRQSPAKDGPIDPGGSIGYDLDVGESTPILFHMPVRLKAVLPDGIQVEVDLPPRAKIQLSRPAEEDRARIEFNILPNPPGPPKLVA